VRVALGKRGVESHLVEQRRDGALQPVNFQRLAQRVFDRHARIE